MRNSSIKALFVILLLSLSLSLFAAGGNVTGKITEAGTNDVLPGANVTVQGTRIGAASGTNGIYTISNLPAGTHTLVVTFMGYKPQTKEVTVQAGARTTVDFVLESEVLTGQEISILADRAQERKTPVAFSNVQKVEMEARLGSRDIPLVLNVTPSVYSTPQGGGAGDARVNVRGFNQQNVAIMVNGVPVNDMENGWVYWSNWDGLGDATSSIQMQRGLSSVNLATPSIGGTMNIITDPAALSAGSSLKQEFGNDGFLKTTFSVASGIINDKYSFSGSLVRKTGDGLVEGTWTDAWAYYIGLGYQINNKNRLEFYALGAPQRHGQASYMQNIGTYSHDFAAEISDYSPAALEAFPEAASGRKYNQTFNEIKGVYASEGQEAWNGGIHRRYSRDFLNERENYFHKPLVNLNWYSQLSSKVNLFSTLYWSGGTGGGSGTLGSLKWDYTLPNSRRIDWDATFAANKENATGARGILRNSVNNQWTVGAIAKVNYKPVRGLDLNAG
ncbi:TonB-dependent receptor, partial [candidate division KSB1 bacterium]